ncbi:MAG TPA: DUF1264 domain-containing protein [Nitrospiraceae bacterium]|nr:DUF1264 domain-containing protein [Nitrospiraceae bacterium]
MWVRLVVFSAFGLSSILGGPVWGEEKKASPADGFTIHVIAPHKFEDGTVHGPYHHYCKGISPEVLQCLLFTSTEPNALLTDIEYFVAKPVARGAVSVDVWNKFYHDHEVEIATGRVQVLDMPEDKAKAVAEAAAKTDGIIFHLWPEGAKAPTGEVGHPQSVGHKHRSQ